MRFYFDHTQTPEMQSLPTSEARRELHNAAQAAFQKDYPNVGLRGLCFVTVCMALFCGTAFWIFGEALSSSEQTGGLSVGLLVLAAVSAGFGTLVHFQLVLHQLRPYYRRILEKSR